jgi:AAA+ superfamily predicted ATPase
MTTTPADALLGLERPGVTVTGVLPDPAWNTRWSDIVVDPAIKRRLLSFGLFCLTQRGSLSTVSFPVHGLALLSGPPGTGKTTLAHGLAQQIAVHLADPELASHGLPLVVLVDEAETLAVSRQRASFETNPVDVHRATGAVLTGADRLAAEHRNVVLVATTNDEQALDAAFLSRVDLRERFELPPLEAVARILVDTLAQVGVVMAADAPQIAEVAAACVAAGTDARQVRKLVLHAVVSNGIELALAPQSMRAEHVAALSAIFP